MASLSPFVPRAASLSTRITYPLALSRSRNIYNFRRVLQVSRIRRELSGLYQVFSLIAKSIKIKRTLGKVLDLQGQRETGQLPSVNEAL